MSTQNVHHLVALVMDVERCFGARRCYFNLRFFVNAPHQRAFGWVEIKTHDVGRLVIEPGVGAELEVLDPLQLQAVFCQMRCTVAGLSPTYSDIGGRSSG